MNTGRKMRNASDPVRKVISNWLMLPNMVMSIPSMWLAFFRMNARPKYSPTLLGVKELIVTPVSTATTDCKRLTFSIFEISFCHFMASSIQFTAIRRTTNTKVLRKSGELRSVSRAFTRAGRSCFQKTWFIIKK